jgi:Domain of unknown function (DUF4873)
MGDDEDGYTGPATFTMDDTSLTVEVVLRGNFEPVDGRYHWYGRIQRHPSLSDGLRKLDVVLRTPHGEAKGTLSDQDTWGRYRVTGTSRPPFEVPVSLADLPAGS